MTVDSALAFVAAVSVFAATPGPAILACVAQALGSGFRSAVALAAGIVLGDLLFLLVAVYGLAAIASLLEDLFVVLRIAGGGYLVWMGWKIWTAIPALPGVGEGARRQAFPAGLLLTLGNPKVILFYLGFLPAFLDLSRLSSMDVVAVSALLVGVLFAVNLAYAWMASRARRWVGSATAIRRLQRSAGSILVAAGVYAAVRR